MDYQHCAVIENKLLVDDIFRIKLYAPWLCQDSHPGQFVMVGQSFAMYLKRPFGIAGVDRQTGVFSLLIKQVGEGTQYLSGIQSKQELSVLGPLGKGFPMPQKTDNPLLIAGGMGIAPLLYLAQSLYQQKISFDIVYGEKRKELLLETEELQTLARQVYYSTEDGSLGQAGYPTVLLPSLFQQGKYQQLYVCGPIPMMRVVASLAQQYSIPCYVSLEERMGCGYGVCMGCVCKIKQGVSLNNLRVCKEGPVFLSEEVEWDG